MESIGSVSLKSLIGFLSFFDELFCDPIGVPLNFPLYPERAGVVTEEEPSLLKPEIEHLGLELNPVINIFVNSHHISQQPANYQPG